MVIPDDHYYKKHIPPRAAILRKIFGSMQKLRGVPRLLWWLRSWTFPDSLVLVDTPDGLPITISKDDYGQLMLFYFPYCPDLKALLTDLLHPGDICYDLGANVGVLTAIMAKLVAPEGIVLAVDPNPRVTKQLEITIRNFWQGQIQIIEAGISYQTGNGILKSPEGGFSESMEVFNNNENEGEKVNLITIDALFKDRGLGKVPTLIKVDIEGNEVYLIKSMQELFGQSYRPILLIEFHPEKCIRRHIAAEDVRDQLVELGYLDMSVEATKNGYRLQPNSGERIGHENILFFTKDHLKTYPAIAACLERENNLR